MIYLFLQLLLFILARSEVIYTYSMISEVIRVSRYRFPPWLDKCICVLEKAILPILIFQLIRTLFLTTTFDLILLGILIGIFIAFHLRWI
ncbi:hypothetical protein [Pseudogracilibacillus auburnensis]|uniref:hypothetical protein n=1 Tax=Pseudogracilibacillus auburnensis TaxID=1494959 RepID=UPI003CC82291